MMGAMNSVERREFDVVIVGGGLVGATFACLLEPLGLRVALLDRRAFDSGSVAFKQEGVCFDARVSAVSLASQELFRGMGVWQGMESRRCCAYTAMDVWDGDGTGRVRFTAGEVNQPELGHIIENSVMLDVLYSRLSGSGAVELISPCVVTGLREGGEGDLSDSGRAKGVDEHGGPHNYGQSVTVVETDGGVEFGARLVVAADGGQSLIRRLAGFATREWDYEHEALVTTVRTELPHCNTALQRFMSTGPLAFLPLAAKSMPEPEPVESVWEQEPVRSVPEPVRSVPRSDSTEFGLESEPQSGADNQRYCSIVWSMVPEMAREVMQLSDVDFRGRLGAAIEHRLGGIEWADRRFSFPLRQCHAVDYVRRGMALVGDAAHTIHPLAGQGVNLGLQDVKVLSEELARAVAVGRSPGDLVVLRRYQRRRKTHNLGMMWLMEGFKRLFAQQSPSVRWLRNLGMAGIDGMPPLKRQLVRRAMKFS